MPGSQTDPDPADEAVLVESVGRALLVVLGRLGPTERIAFVRSADLAAVPVGARLEIRGAQAVVEETLLLWRNAQNAAVALVDGRVGLVVAPNGRLRSVITLTFASGRITGYSVIAEPARLEATAIAVLDWA